MHPYLRTARLTLHPPAHGDAPARWALCAFRVGPYGQQSGRIIADGSLSGVVPSPPIEDLLSAFRRICEGHER